MDRFDVNEIVNEIMVKMLQKGIIDIKEIDKDHVNGQDVILYKTKQKDDIINEHIYYVNVTCHSTLRQYFLCNLQISHNCWSLGCNPFHS